MHLLGRWLNELEFGYIRDDLYGAASRKADDGDLGKEYYRCGKSRRKRILAVVSDDRLHPCSALLITHRRNILLLKISLTDVSI